jgi:hypothetical protein
MSDNKEDEQYLRWRISTGPHSVFVCKYNPPKKDSREYNEFWRLALRLTEAGQLEKLIKHVGPLFTLNWLNLPFPEDAYSNVEILMWLAEVDKTAHLDNGDTVDAIYYQQLHVYWALEDEKRLQNGNIVALDVYRKAVSVTLAAQEEKEKANEKEEDD